MSIGGRSSIGSDGRGECISLFEDTMTRQIPNDNAGL